MLIEYLEQVGYRASGSADNWVQKFTYSMESAAAIILSTTTSRRTPHAGPTLPPLNLSSMSFMVKNLSTKWKPISVIKDGETIRPVKAIETAAVECMPARAYSSYQHTRRFRQRQGGTRDQKFSRSRCGQGRTVWSSQSAAADWTLYVLDRRMDESVG